MHTESQKYSDEEEKYSYEEKKYSDAPSKFWDKAGSTISTIATAVECPFD